MLSDGLLKKYNFFELYPPDGGGGLIFHEMPGTMKDREICRKIIQENALGEFGSLPELDFKKFYPEFIEECAAAVEKVVAQHKELLKDDPGDPVELGNGGLTFRL